MDLEKGLYSVEERNKALLPSSSEVFLQQLHLQDPFFILILSDLPSSFDASDQSLSFLPRLSKNLCPTLMTSVSISQVWWLIFLLHPPIAPATGQISQSLCPSLSPCSSAASSLGVLTSDIDKWPVILSNSTQICLVSEDSGAEGERRALYGLAQRVLFSFFHLHFKCSSTNLISLTFPTARVFLGDQYCWSCSPMSIWTDVSPAPFSTCCSPGQELSSSMLL